MSSSLNCSVCLLDRPRHKVKRIKKQWVCSFCYQERREKKRDYLKHEVLGLKTRQEWLDDCKRKREIKELQKKELPVIHRIKVKGSKIKVTSRQVHGYLTFVERQILYKKYRTSGLCHEEVIKKINETSKYLSEFVKRLREEKKSEVEININFKEEFAKLIR